MQKKVKIGVLGNASIARRSVIPAIFASENFELVGVASKSVTKASMNEHHKKIKYFDTYEKLLSENLDAVYIPLPNSLHFDWVKKSLDKNVHVLCEKSLACSKAEVEYLCNLAHDKDLALLENFQFQHHVQMKYIQKVLKKTELGTVQLMRISFGFPPFEDRNNIRYSKELGGGALLDAGAYPIKLSQLLTGEQLGIGLSVMSPLSDEEVDISGSGTLVSAESRTTIQIAFGFNHIYQNKLEIWGSSGRLTADRIFTAGPGVTATVRIEDRDKNIVEKKFLDDHFVNMLDYFSDCIATPTFRINEYLRNINQAKLIEDFHDFATR